MNVRRNEVGVEHLLTVPYVLSTAAVILVMKQLESSNLDANFKRSNLTWLSWIGCVDEMTIKFTRLTWMFGAQTLTSRRLCARWQYSTTRPGFELLNRKFNGPTGAGRSSPKLCCGSYFSWKPVWESPCSGFPSARLPPRAIRRRIL